MDYAYIYYPSRIKNLADQLPLIKYLPEYLAEKARPYYPPVLSSFNTDQDFPQGEAIACAWPDKKRIIDSVKTAVKDGTKIVGIHPLLLRNSSLEHKVLEDLEIPIARGDIAALCCALEAVRLVIKSKGLSYNKAQFVVIGTHLPLGRLIVRILAREAKYITLFDRLNTETDRLFSQVMYESGLALKLSRFPEQTLQNSDIVITASEEGFFSTDLLSAGAIFCDLTGGQIKYRDDIIIIQDPGFTIPPKYGFLKMNPMMLEAIPPSLAEVIISCLEHNYELFSLQREMTINQVDKTFRLIKKHGFCAKISGISKFS